MKVSIVERLENNFAAKIRWRIRHDRSQSLVTVADKFLVKDFAKSRDVATCPTLLASTNPLEVDFDGLPPSCIIKATHGSGWNILKKDGDYYHFGNGSEVDLKSGEFSQSNGKKRLSALETAKICNNWVHSKYSSNEWVYHQMTPRIIVEELLHPLDGAELFDYRFYTFRGKVAAINVGSPAYRRENTNAFFTPGWKLIELSKYTESLPATLPPRPRDLEQMLAACGRLGDQFGFVRIDFYQTDKGPILGEMTIYPEGGKPLSPTGCRKFNRWLGRQWKMSLSRELSVLTNNVRDVAGAVGRKIGIQQRGAEANHSAGIQNTSGAA